ncbi:hypothetical protein EAH76_14685 [Sphingomonas glacialis]|uniref:Uncharacterized protein n=1 Tax=Sphingomonas glacialis TaxID=658225 RepID=A0A502FR02_9SPHN|nr:hypothetical protein EAH76_14685 [Sphingomonas glacialis]
MLSAASHRDREGDKVICIPTRYTIGTYVGRGTRWFPLDAASSSIRAELRRRLLVEETDMRD